MADTAAEEIRSMPPVSRLMLEAVAEAFDMDKGTWALEVIFKDGNYQGAYRKHGPIRADELGQRFDTPE